MFKLGVSISIVSVASFVAGLPWGAVGVAAAYTISDYTLRLPLIFVISSRRGPVRLIDLAMTCMPHLVASAVTAFVLVIIAEAAPLLGLKIAFLLVPSYGLYVAVLCTFSDKRRILINNFHTATTVILRRFYVAKN